jgi:CheY-like chemotaxis protein
LTRLNTPVTVCSRALTRLEPVFKPEPSLTATPVAEAASLRAEQTPQVLVVDDDDTIRDAIADAPEFEGYSVARARHGEEALRQVRAAPPRVIVMDLMMPVMDGWTFVERCRAESLCAGVAIVVVSASHNLRSAARRLTANGVSAVIAKPFALDVLIGAVERLLRPA